MGFDTLSMRFRDLNEGTTMDLAFSGSAATRLRRATGGIVGSVAKSTVTKNVNNTAKPPDSVGSVPSPKHVVIPDLHRVGQALKVSLDHLDRPAAMLAVFGDATELKGVPADVAARGFHQKLIR